MTRTLLVIAGGTGGHIYPGLAVGELARARGWNVLWMGNPEGMEARIVARRGYEMLPVRFFGLRGKGLLRALMLPVNLLRAFWQSFAALGRARPSVVLGMGGYITFPGAMMAVLRGVPVAIHEQNSVAGLANRVLAHVADRVLSGFPDALPGGEWVGNPVRAEICALDAPAERYAARSGPLRLLVVGGSLGAKALNEAVPAALARIDASSRPRVVHQSGEQHIDALRAAYRDAGVEADLVAFIEDMAARYAEADVVVCRAGAITVAEIAAAGVASVLVPFPHAVDDHQTSNARFLAQAGAARLLPQAELTPAALARLLGELTRERLAEMAEKARALARPDAAVAVADACAALAPA